MSAEDVVALLGPLPLRGDAGRMTNSSVPGGQGYCVDYFFFNGGPGVDLCFDDSDRVVAKAAYQFSFIS